MQREVTIVETEDSGRRAKRKEMMSGKGSPVATAWAPKEGLWGSMREPMKRRGGEREPRTAPPKWATQKRSMNEIKIIVCFIGQTRVNSVLVADDAESRAQSLAVCTTEVLAATKVPAGMSGTRVLGEREGEAMVDMR